MATKGSRKNRKMVLVALTVCLCGAAFLGGCADMCGYSNESLFPADIETVYVEMFENSTFERGVEYWLTDAIAKRIDASTPYKIVSSRDRADTVLTGYLAGVSRGLLTAERETGRALEKEAMLTAVVSWKNLRTGELLLDSKRVSATSTYSEWQNQGFDYAATLTANKLAVRIVEQMEMEW